MLSPLILAEAGEPGMLDINIISCVWVLIIFVILVLILYKTAWKNVLAGLKAREERIRGDIAAAEAAKAKADASLREFNTQLATAEEKAKTIVAQAALDAEKIAAGIRLRSQQEAEEIKERANEEIEATKRQALSEIYDQAVNLSTSIAEKIIRRNLNPDDQRDLVKQSLDQLQSLNA
jgi:F-type H+-transporting ATPase subunit b